MNWNNYTCPNCGAEAAMGIMSLVARCPNCPAVYVQDSARTGWYASEAAYYEISNREKNV